MPTNAIADYEERSTMLRSALGDYLDRVKEREFDLPFLLLLPELGFYDVHFTHGAVEFGKDFIAKRREDGVVIQYSFQTKAGNIGQSAWENHIQGQLLSSVLLKLNHASFDAQAPHRPVLVTTGDLVGNAGQMLRDLNREISETYGKPPIDLWAKQNLLDFLVEHGLSGMLRTNAPSVVEHGRFLIVYGQSLQGRVSASEIEGYARDWLVSPVGLNRLLQSALEAEILSQQCAEHGIWYEAASAHLGLIRLLCAAAHEGEAGDVAEAFEQAVARVHGLCMAYLAELRNAWGRHRNLLTLGPLDAVTYPVQCARVAEMASLAYFTSEEEGPRAEAATFLDDFIHHEPGCAHPVSDRYAATVVMATLVLCNEARDECARDLVRSATVWLCDRYEQGLGLAGLGADAGDETKILLGSGFDVIDVPRVASSFLASAITDLAAFLGDPRLYRDVVNDVRACDIRPEYVGARDEAEPFGAAGEGVSYFHSVTYEETLSRFEAFVFGDHLAGEKATFRFADALGPFAAVFLMVLWRDRYFPKIWPHLAPNWRRDHRSQETEACIAASPWSPDAPPGQ